MNYLLPVLPLISEKHFSRHQYPNRFVTIATSNEPMSAPARITMDIVTLLNSAK